MLKPGYKKNSGAVFNLYLHLVWCPKYRRPILVGAVAERLKELLIEKADTLGIEIAGMEVMPDHVHLFIGALPTGTPAKYVQSFKGYTSRVLRQEFPHLERKMRVLWSPSYYIGSAGNASASVIKKYIAEQKTRDGEASKETPQASSVNVQTSLRLSFVEVTKIQPEERG